MASIYNSDTLCDLSGLPIERSDELLKRLKKVVKICLTPDWQKSVMVHSGDIQVRHFHSYDCNAVILELFN